MLLLDTMMQFPSLGQQILHSALDATFLQFFQPLCGVDAVTCLKIALEGNHFVVRSFCSVYTVQLVSFEYYF